MRGRDGHDRRKVTAILADKVSSSMSSKLHKALNTNASESDVIGVENSTPWHAISAE